MHAISWVMDIPWWLCFYIPRCLAKHQSLSTDLHSQGSPWSWSCWQYRMWPGFFSSHETFGTPLITSDHSEHLKDPRGASRRFPKVPEGPSSDRFFKKLDSVAISLHDDTSVSECLTLQAHDWTYPIGSMYAIYGNIYHQYTTPNVSIYSIHGSSGYWNILNIPSDVQGDNSMAAKQLV